MPTSYNGWPASEHLTIRPLVVNGVSFAPGIRDNDDIEVVFRYIAEQWADRVEPLMSPGCWGYSYRENRNASNLSCHSSGTAIDINAPRHPNGVEASSSLLASVHPILNSVSELGDLVHWGGDWHRSNGLTPDPMHFELHAYDLALLRRVADRIRARNQEDIVTPEDIDKIAAAVVKRLLDTDLYPRLGKVEQTVADALKGKKPDKTP